MSSPHSQDPVSYSDSTGELSRAKQTTSDFTVTLNLDPHKIGTYKIIIANAPIIINNNHYNNYLGTDGEGRVFPCPVSFILPSELPIRPTP